jgi:hypothetical protein
MQRRLNESMTIYDKDPDQRLEDGELQEIRGLWRWVWARLSRVSQPEAEAPPRRPATLRAAVPLADAPLAVRRRLGVRRRKRHEADMFAGSPTL